MLEGKIILALTAREFDFVLEYPGEEADVRHPVPENTVEELSEKTEYGRGQSSARATELPVVCEQRPGDRGDRVVSAGSVTWMEILVPCLF